MYVYLIKSINTGYYKIGFSSNPQKRLRELQTGCPDPLQLISIYESSRARKIEKALHHGYSYLRLHNEWFELALEHEFSFLDECAKIDKNLIILEGISN